MRYYLTQRHAGGLFIIGEAIGGTIEGEPFIHPSMDHDGMVTREQLLEAPGGRQAVWRWENHDDEPWQAAYDEQRHAEQASEVRELAATGNPWARELIENGYPEPDVTRFLRGDHAFGDWRPQIV